MRLLFDLALLACAFPFTQILPLGSYNQPYAALLGGLIMLRYHRSAMAMMPARDFWALLALMLVGLTLFLTTSITTLGAQDLKYLLTFVTPFFLVPAMFFVIEDDRDRAAKILTWAACLWSATAVIQQFLAPTFLIGLVGSHSAASEDILASGRGVLSLAPEPTHHGFHMIVLGGALAVIGRKRWPVILCILDAILLARSSSALLALGLGSILWCCLDPRRLLIPVAVVGIVAAAGLGYLTAVPESDSRIISLIGLALSNPGDLLLVDYSVNLRLGGMIASIVESFESGLIPHGTSHAAWLIDAQRILRETPWLLDLSNNGFPSGFGLLLYQGGWLLLPTILLIVARLTDGHRLGLLGITSVSTIFVFLGQYSLATPDFALIYGVMLWYARRRSRAVEKQPIPKPAIFPALAAPATAKKP